MSPSDGLGLTAGDGLLDYSLGDHFAISARMPTLRYCRVSSKVSALHASGDGEAGFLMEFAAYKPSELEVAVKELAGTLQSVQGGTAVRGAGHLADEVLGAEPAGRRHSPGG